MMIIKNNGGNAQNEENAFFENCAVLVGAVMELEEDEVGDGAMEIMSGEVGAESLVEAKRYIEEWMGRK